MFIYLDTETTGTGPDDRNGLRPLAKGSTTTCLINYKIVELTKKGKNGVGYHFRVNLLYLYKIVAI